MRVAIIGASGFLGTKLFTQFQQQGWEVYGTSTRQRHNFLPLNITDRAAVVQFFAAVQPEIVIHTAALADPDVCEDNQELAYAVNVEGTKNVIFASQQQGSKFVYISTNGIFDGKKGNYSETDAAYPLNVYGRTKVAAEQHVLDVPSALILRFDLLYGYNGQDAPNGFFSSVIKGSGYQAMNNQKRQPLLVDDVGTAIQTLLSSYLSGVYHLAGPDVVTKYELGIALEQIVRPGEPSQLVPIQSEIKKALRPENTTLDTSKAHAAGLRFHSLDEGLILVRYQYNVHKI